MNRGVFHGLRDLRSLAIRSHNDVWPAMNLELNRDSLAHDVDKLERLDLSCNNINSFRSQLLCDLTSLQVLNVSHNRLTDLVVDLGLTSDNNSSSSSPTAMVVTGYCTATSLTLLDASYNHLVSLGGGGGGAGGILVGARGGEILTGGGGCNDN